MKLLKKGGSGLEKTSSARNGAQNQLNREEIGGVSEDSVMFDVDLDLDLNPDESAPEAGFDAENGEELWEDVELDTYEGFDSPKGSYRNPEEIPDLDLGSDPGADNGFEPEELFLEAPEGEADDVSEGMKESDPDDGSAEIPEADGGSEEESELIRQERRTYPARKKRRKAARKKEADGISIAKKLMRAVSCAAFLVVLWFVWMFVTEAVEDKQGVNKFRPLIESETRPDVLLVGTSHVTEGLYPLELWDHYGIAAYNIGSSLSTMAVNYWKLVLTLKYSDPKLVVLDCSKLRENVKTPEVVGALYWAFDAFPLSYTKFEAIKDLLDDPYLEEEMESEDGDARFKLNPEQREMIPFLFNFLVYHDRWRYLSLDELKVKDSTQKGAYYSTEVAPATEYKKISSSMQLDEESVGMTYVRKIADLCRSRGIELVLTYLPYPANTTRQKESHSAEALANELGLKMLNYLNSDVVDYTIDFKDESHLNAAGARKVTKYLGDYLSENFDLPDRRGDDNYSSWEEDNENYLVYRGEQFAKQTSMESYLMLLNDNDFDCVIEVLDYTSLLSAANRSLLLSLGVDPDELSDDVDYILVRGGEESTVIYNFKGSGDAYPTVLGSFVSKENEEGNIVCSLNGTDIDLASKKASTSGAIRVCLMKSGDPSQIIDSAEFRCTGLTVTDIAR